VKTFKDDRVDAGDIGAGHTVTAIYEITPAAAKKRQIDPLRYQSERDSSPPAKNARDELAFVKVRYKLPGASASQLMEHPCAPPTRWRSSMVRRRSSASPLPSLRSGNACESALDGYRFANIAELANASRGADPEGYRAEFVRLARMAETLGAVAQR
jgi:Ca-activated chloride channel family protein